LLAEHILISLKICKGNPSSINLVVSFHTSEVMTGKIEMWEGVISKYSQKAVKASRKWEH